MKFIELSEVYVDWATEKLADVGKVIINMDNVDALVVHKIQNLKKEDVVYTSVICNRNVWSVRETPEEILVKKTSIGG